MLYFLNFMSVYYLTNQMKTSAISIELACFVLRILTVPSPISNIDVKLRPILKTFTKYQQLWKVDILKTIFRGNKII